MTETADAAAERGKGRYHVQVADETLNFRPVEIDDLTPTGAQLALAAGFKPKQNVSVLQVLANGELEDIRPSETADLRHAEGRFIIVETDREYWLMIDGERFSWPSRIISVAVMRKLGSVPPEKSLYEERADEPDRLLGDQDMVDLDARGVESFVSRKTTWKLNVQGVKLDVDTPTILVSDALTRAGFDIKQGWHIFLKVAGEAKREVSLSDTIDLRTPGIEKLRLTPREVNNGEAPSAPRRDFSLLDADEEYLDGLGLRWETIIDNNRRWLLIRNYPVPAGYTANTTLLALDIPTPYPRAEIDMFYTRPPLALSSGRAIDRTQIAAVIERMDFNGWSRHRGAGSPWNPATDNVATHLALVESALLKEIGA